MNLLFLARWEVLQAFRTAIPAAWARLLTVVLALAVEGAFLILLLRVPHVEGKHLPAGFLAGFVSFNLLLATGAASRGVAALIEGAGRFELQRLSPASDASFYLPLVPIVLAALIPLTLFTLPLILWEGRGYPLLALGFVSAGACALAWAVVIAIALGVALGKKLGRERASRLLRVCGSSLALAALLGFGALARWRGRSTGLVALLIATPIFLPVAIRRVTRALFVTLQLPEEEVRVREPSWGSPGWIATLKRTLAIPLLATLCTSAAVLVWAPAARLPVLLILLFAAVCAPLERLIGPELSCPDRLAMAPAGMRYRRALIVRVGGSSALCGCLVAAALSSGNWTWAAATCLSLLLLPLTYFIGSLAVRLTVQFALAGTVLWALAFWIR